MVEIIIFKINVDLIAELTVTDVDYDMITEVEEPQLATKKFPDLKKFRIRSINYKEWKTVKKVQNGRHLEKCLIKKQISFKQNNKCNCTICKESVKLSMRTKYSNECQCTSPFCLHRYKAQIFCKTEALPLKKTSSCFVQKITVYWRSSCLQNS